MCASPAFASTGGVFFDNLGNAAAGNPFALFNGAFEGQHNVGLGASVMTRLQVGSDNVAVGAAALANQTIGDNNIAVGANALAAGAHSIENVAAGSGALFANTEGSDNIATGVVALVDNTTGHDNIATGFDALSTNTTGNQNLAAGTDALENSTGDSNIALGFGAGQNLTTGSNDIDIANDGKAGESKAIRIGAKGDQTHTYIAGISGRTVNGTVEPVVVNAKGQLGTASTASAKAIPAKPLSGTVRHLVATVKRQQLQIAQLQREVRSHG